MASGLQNLVPRPGRGSIWTFFILVVVSAIVIVSVCGSMSDSDKEKRSETASGGATGVADDVVQRLKRTLTACKLWVTRSHNTLEQLLSDTEPDIIALENAIDEFEKRLNSFDISQGELELAVPDEDMDQCIQDAGDSKDSKMSALLKASKIVSTVKDPVS